MGTISPRHIVEQVLVTRLAAEPGLTGVNVYAGENADIDSLPKCVVLCDNARTPDEIPDGLGNFIAGIRITLVSEAHDTTLEQHRGRCAALLGSMQDVAAIKAAFAATGDAICYDIYPQSEDEGIDNSSWASVFLYDMAMVVNPGV